MNMKRFLYGLVALVFFGCATAQAAQDASNEQRVEIRINDVTRFLDLYDATHHHPTTEQLQKQYLDPGSPGLHQFVKSRIKSAKKLAAAIEKHPQAYADLHECVAGLPDVRKRLRVVFSRLASLYSQASFPPVTFVVGRNNTGGTTTASGVIIGVEVICRADWLQSDMTERFVRLIAHEYVHVQQPAAQVAPPPNATLLFQSLIEGGAEFIDELTSGEAGNAQLQVWVRPRQCEVEQRFAQQAEGTDVSGWLYNGPGTPQKPGDLGYWVGYRITKAYYLHAADKRQAIFDILHITNANASAFLEQSGWKPETDCKITYGAQTKAAVPTVFAPGVISRAPHEAAPAFTPDGRIVFFQRGNPSESTILVSHREDGRWSMPTIASFSGKWNDMEPGMAPDGSYLVFISSRPIIPGGEPIDGFFNGKHFPGQGGNIWRVDRTADGWGKPHRLPDAINSGTSIFAPSVARDGSLYFMHPDKDTGHFRLFRAQWRNGHYLKPAPLPFSTGATTDVDPAVDPDERFLVFGSGRKPAADMDLFIVFHTDNGWGTPIHLGTTVNSPGSDAESRLSPDEKWLYFSSERLVPSHFPRTREQARRDNQMASVWNNGQYNIWRVLLAPWLKAETAK